MASPTSMKGCKPPLDDGFEFFEAARGRWDLSELGYRDLRFLGFACHSNKLRHSERNQNAATTF
jgi:hypothetical protein